MPKPTGNHRRLASFVGAWTGTETCHPSPWDPRGGAAKGSFTYSMALDGFYLVSDYRQERDGLPDFLGHGVYGFDAAAGRYTMDWFDSMGGRVRAEGRWEGDALIFESRNPTTCARYVHGFEGGEYVFRLDLAPDGAAWRPMLEGRYRRA